MRYLALIPLLVSMAGTSVRGESDTTSLLKNGNLESGAAGWPTGKGISIVEEEGNHFLRLQVEEPGVQVQAYNKIKLPGGIQKLNVSFRVRFTDIKPGAQSWHTGKLLMHFKDAAGQTVQPDPSGPAFKGSSSSWVEKTIQLTVPEGAVFLEFMPALFQVAQGTLDIDDMVIVPE